MGRLGLAVIFVWGGVFYGAACSSSSESLPQTTPADSAVDASGASSSVADACSPNDLACSTNTTPDATVADGPTDALTSGDAIGECSVDNDCVTDAHAGCSHLCSDGSNPCQRACVANQCVARGCPGVDAGSH